VVDRSNRLNKPYLNWKFYHNSETPDYEASIAERKYLLRNRTNYQPLSCSGVFTELKAIFSHEAQLQTPFQGRYHPRSTLSQGFLMSDNTNQHARYQSNRVATIRFTHLSNVQIVFHGRKKKLASYLIFASKRSLGRNPAGSGCLPQIPICFIIIV